MGCAHPAKTMRDNAGRDSVGPPPDNGHDARFRRLGYRLDWLKPRTEEGGVGEPVSRQGDGNLPTAGESLENWSKSVGDVAAPLLAGFSFMSVIAVSGSTEHFRWPGEAILALTIAAIMLIAALQCAEYVHHERWARPSRSEASAKWPVIFFQYLSRTGGWRGWTRRFYHLGLTALLAGLAFALAPQNVTGGQDMLR